VGSARSRKSAWSAMMTRIAAAMVGVSEGGPRVRKEEAEEAWQREGEGEVGEVWLREAGEVWQEGEEEWVGVEAVVGVQAVEGQQGAKVIRSCPVAFEKSWPRKGPVKRSFLCFFLVLSWSSLCGCGLLALFCLNGALCIACNSCTSDELGFDSHRHWLEASARQLQTGGKNLEH